MWRIDISRSLRGIQDWGVILQGISTYRCQSPVSINLALICFITCSSESVLDIASTSTVTLRSSEQQPDDANTKDRPPLWPWPSTLCIRNTIGYMHKWIKSGPNHMHSALQGHHHYLYTIKRKKDTVNLATKTIKQRPEQLERQLCPKTLLAQVVV